MDVAELVSVCWLDVKGKMGMNPLKFVRGQVYATSFVMKRTCDAQNVHNIKLALEFNCCKPRIEKVVDLTKMPANTWTLVNVADFEADFGGIGVDMTVSLVNHEDVWKSGLKIAGIIVQPVVF